MDESEIRKLTARTFDRVSCGFDSARPAPWASIGEIGDLGGKVVLDLGAGTGRNSAYLLGGGASVVAADVSIGMLNVLLTKLGAGHDIKLVRCDAIGLPFRDSVFDVVALVAALHHIPGDAGRAKAVKEVERVMVKGGKAFITVWAPQGTPRGARAAWAGSVPGKDVLVPWSNKGERYYHLFSEGELRGLMERSGLSVSRIFLERVSESGAGANLVAIATK